MMLGYLQRAGPGKATPRQSLAARQPGNSWPLRLYPDVMRRYSPLLCCAMVLGKYKKKQICKHKYQTNAMTNIFLFLPFCVFPHLPIYLLASLVPIFCQVCKYLCLGVK